MVEVSDTKAILIAALVAFVLYMSGFLVILTPMPLMYAAIVRGKDAGIMTTAISALLVAVVYFVVMPTGGAISGAIAYLPAPGAGLANFMPHGFLPLFGIGFFGFFAAIALTLSHCVGKRLILSQWGSRALLAGLAVVAVTIALANIFCEPGFIAGVKSFTMSALNEVIKANEVGGMSNPQFTLIANNAEKVAGSVIEVLPALVFVYAVITVAINLMLSRRFIKIKNSMSHIPGVTRFRLSDWVIWPVISSGVIFFANSYFLHSAAVGTMALNCLIGLGVLYFLQGMAVTVYFLQRVRFSLLRTIAYVAMIIFLQTVSVGFIVLGIADVWADFRLRHLRMQHEHR